MAKLIQRRDNNPPEKKPEPDNIFRRFGKNLNRLRRETSISLKVLSAQSGFAANFLFELEHGTKGASFATIVKLADIFGVDISEFFKPLEKTSPLDFLADTEERAGKVLFFLCEQLTDWTEDITKGLSEGNETE